MKDTTLQNIVLIYLVTINVVTFFMYGIDKWKAKKSKMRIRETALLGLVKGVGTKVVLRECPLCVSDAAEFLEEQLNQTQNI